MIPESDVAIETLGLRKAYRSVRGRAVAVDGLDLRVPAGGVHALLGLAGSGKTTTLRLLTGLARADGGAMKIFGTHVPDGLPDLAGRIGAVVGEPGFQARLSGRRNLALLASAAGVPRARVDEVLTRVVLADRAKAAYGTYSADEERRLALAAALLRDPDLLVVDDPSAGLDAVGAREIRHALRRLADQGKTVLVATGVLTEAQQIADTVTVLDGGRVLVQGTVADLLGDAKVSVRVGIDEPGKAAATLRAAGFKVRADGDALHVDDVAEPADIGRALAKQKLFASELVPQREDLAAVVGRLRPVVAPTPEPPSRAEERAARKAAERKAADRKKAADQRKADKEAAAKQAAAEEKAAEDAAAKQAATDARAAAKAAALAERAAAKEARRSTGKPAVSGIASAGERAAAAAVPGPAPKPAAKPAPSAVSKPAPKLVPNPAGSAASPKVTPKALPKSAPKPATAGKAAAAAETDPPPKQSKLAQRRAAFDAKVAEKQEAAEARLAERKAAADAKAAAKQAAADAKAAAKQAAADAKAAAMQAKVDARQARIDDKQAKVDDKAAQKQAAIDAKESAAAERAATKAAAEQAKAEARQAAIDDRAAKKQGAADARAARLSAQKEGAKALLSRRAAETSGGQVEPGGRDQGTTTKAAPAGDSKPAADKASSRSGDGEPEEVELDDLEPDESELDELESAGEELDDLEPDDLEPDEWESEDLDPGTPDPGTPKPGPQDQARRQGQGRQNPGQQRPGQGRGKKRSKGRR
ncbi:ATP-binding cassette domain-containing protein [Promicromonospora sp. NPDC057138]|uniref:ATP-binding cassette domain-containing protein n=1 Tax=Promicromonospora sp. NPDC057138 TaxID=3346031 RepID=UPI0036359C2C